MIQHGLKDDDWNSIQNLIESKKINLMTKGISYSSSSNCKIEWEIARTGDIKREILLFAAIRCRAEGIINSLLNYDDNLIKLQLKSNSEVEETSALLLAVIKNISSHLIFDMVRILAKINKEALKNTFSYAFVQKNYPIVEMILEIAPELINNEIKSSRKFPVFQMIEDGRIDILRKPEVFDWLELAVKNGEQRPLFIDALYSKNLDMIELCLGVSGNYLFDQETETGNSILHLALMFELGSEIIAKLIKAYVNAGGDLNIINNQGNTPLHLAFDKDMLLEATQLISFGAIACNRNKNGVTEFFKGLLRSDYTVLEKIMQKSSWVTNGSCLPAGLTGFEFTSSMLNYLDKMNYGMGRYIDYETDPTIHPIVKQQFSLIIREENRQIYSDFYKMALAKIKTLLKDSPKTHPIFVIETVLASNQKILSFIGAAAWPALHTI